MEGTREGGRGLRSPSRYKERLREGGKRGFRKGQKGCTFREKGTTTWSAEKRRAGAAGPIGKRGDIMNRDKKKRRDA